VPQLSKTKGYKDIGRAQKDNVHGFHSKIGVVLHETVSQNYVGWNDVFAVSNYLDVKDYGIHGITDNDGHCAWAFNLGKAIFYHTASGGTKGKGVANQNFIGVEQISRVMLDYKTRTARIRAWLQMDNELNITAKLIACCARAHGFPIIDNPGNTLLPGITTHWEITNYYAVPGGHVDCHPSHKGGYYPKREVIRLAKRYYALGWRF
jgi:hypothetical protein